MEQSAKNVNVTSGGAPRPTRQSRRSSGKMLVALLVVLLVVACAAITYLIMSRGSNNDDYTQEQVALEIKQKVSRLWLDLPEETPVVTTIENADEVKNQEFFRSVQNGDKLLVFIKEARVIIYRPSEDKIVNAGPVVNDNAGAATETQPSTSEQQPATEEKIE
jgi:hypothetical protein